MPDITLSLSKADYDRATAALAAASGGLSVEDALLMHITTTVDNVERGAAVQAAVEAVTVEPLAVKAVVEQAIESARAVRVDVEAKGVG